MLRALVALPVQFTATPATRVAAALHSAAAQPTTAAPTGVSAPVPPRPEPKAKKGFWSTFLDVFRL